MNKPLLLMIMVIMSLIPSSYAEFNFAYNRLYGDGVLLPGFNFSINVNTSENWNTNIGLLSNVNATQHLNIGGVLNIDPSWLTGFINLQNSVAWNRSGTNVFLAQTGDNVGIGTISPEQILHLTASAASTKLLIETTDATDTFDPMVVFNVDGAQSWAMGIDNSDSNKFKIAESNFLGTSPRLTIDILGNVGIGTTSPSANLNVVGSTTGTIFLEVS